MNGSPFKGYYSKYSEHSLLLDYAHLERNEDDKSILFIDGLVAHGHRMFGLPPIEPTYFCKWDFDIGDILVTAALEVAETFGRIARCLAYSYENVENSLLIPEPALYDVTYVTAKISKFNAQLNSEKYILELVTSTIDFKFSDLANDRYSERVTIDIPSISASILDRFPKSESGQHSIKASFKSSLIMSNFVQKRNMELCREYQQDHISLHDSPFHRCPWLLDNKRRNSPEYAIIGVRAGPVPSIPILAVPPPVTRETIHILDPNLNSSDRHHLGSDEAASSSASTVSRFNDSDTSQSGMSTSDSDIDSITSSVRRRHHRPNLQPASSYLDPEKDIINGKFLPPREWRSVSKKSSSDPVESNFNLQPTSNYSKGEVSAPMTLLDPATQYENFVIQFGSIEGDISPFALGAVNEIIESMGKEDMETSMDTLQIEFFKRLHMRHVTILNPEVTNIRVIVPTITVKYGNLEILEENRGDTLKNHIYFDFHDLNLVVRLREQSNVDQILQAQHSPIKHTVYLNLDSATIGVRKGTPSATSTSLFEQAQEYSPVVLQIDRSEFWWHEEQETTGSLRIKSVDSFVMSDQVRWVGEFLDKNIDELKQITVSSTNESNGGKNRQHHNRAAYVLYQLAKAGESFNIQRDPSVLTRPAYIIQSPLHIRASTSWKIIMRLRHILRTVPNEWRDRHTELLLNGTFTTPLDIKQQTIAIFARWRNWEMTNISSSYVFSYVFMETSLKERLMSVATNTSLDIESIALRLQYAESEDYLCFDYLKLLLNWSGKQFNSSVTSLSPNEIEKNGTVIDFESVLSCLHIRSRYSYLLVDVYTSIEDMILKTQSKKSKEEDKQQIIEQVEDYSIPMLAIRSSFLLEQLSSILVLPSAEIGCQGYNIKLTTFYEQLLPNNRTNAAINAVANCTNLSLDISKRVQNEYGVNNSNEKMFQILVNSSVLTLSGYGQMSACSKYLAARSSEFNVSLEKDLGVLTEFGLELVENDWQYFRSRLNVEALSNQAKPSTPPSSDYSGSMYLQFNAIQTNLVLRILPSLSAMYQSKNSYIKLNHAFSDQVVAELSLDEQLFKIGGTIDQMESGLDLLSVRVVNSVVLIRKEELKGMKDHSIDILGSVNSIECATESITKIIKQVESGIWQVESRHLGNQFGKLCKEMTEIKKAVGVDAKRSDTLTVSSKKPIAAKTPLIKINIKFGTSSLIVPVYGYCISMELDTFAIQASSFLRFEDGFVDGFVTRTPLIFVTSMDEWRIVFYRRSLPDQKYTFIKLQATAQLKVSPDGGVKTKHFLSLNCNYTRVFFTSAIIQSLAEILSNLTEEVVNISIPKSLPPSPKLGKESDEDLSFKMLEKFSATCIASMRIQDLSIAWLFEDKGTNLISHPGLLFGYEMLDIQAESFVANMVLTNVYLTPAIEKQIFLVKSIGPRTANSALLPNVELKVDFHKEVSLRLKGESLKLTLLPSCVVLVSMFLDSISSAQELIGQRNIVADAKPESPAPIKPLRLPFSWRFNVKFDGAVIELWDEVEFFNIEKAIAKSNVNAAGGTAAGTVPDDQGLRAPALALQTPALKAIFEYYSNKKLHLKDRFGCEIVITPTSNVIYSRVVPVVVSMARLVKDIVRANHQFNAARKNENQLVRINSKRLSNVGTGGPIREDVELLFSAIDANIIIRFESQELTLSCLPTAKVSATVSVEKWFIGVNSSDALKSGRVVTANLSIHNFKASLQHLYSRDVSGYISLEDVMVLVTKGKQGTQLEPIRVAGKVTDIMFDLNMKQMQDLEVFQNIWMPSGPLNTPIKETMSILAPNDEAEGIDGVVDKGIVRKFRRASTTVAIPWSVDFAIIKIHGYIEMGQSIGKFDCKLDKFWISLQKNSDWEQHLSAAIDLIFLQSEGRLGSILSLDGLHLRTAIMWDKEVETFTVPLVQAVAGFKSIDSKLSLEYHTFAMAYIDSVNFAMSNQRDHNNILGDRLIAVGDIGSISIFFTALAASYFVDIVYTFKRLRKASHASYEAILNDSSADGSGGNIPNVPKQSRHDRQKSNDEALSSLFSKLRTMFDLRINALNLYVFPNMFSDSSIFTASLNMAHARFVQEQKDGTLESDLRLDMKSVLVALATAKADSELDVAVVSVRDFLAFAAESARSGTIIYVPVFHVAMRSWQKFGQPTVEYTFTSSIGGRVDIGWNLGSVSFIREMWENHARALAQRQQTYSMTISDSKVIATGADLDKNLKEVELNPVYIYVPREPPDIANPQLRQMGEATPPLEWIGLHRQKFPGLTHQFVIVGLQSLVHNIGK